MHIDLGHQEVSRDLPEPLGAVGPLRLGTRALPATGLSIASLVAFVIVAAVLFHDADWRALFELPFAAGWLAWPSALLALAIVVRTGSRPGRHLPRYWSLSLAAMTFVLAILATLPHEIVPTPLLHALVVAGAAAVLTLLPRLAKIRPHSPWIQRVALLSLLGVLLLAIPTACWIGDKVERNKENATRATVREIFSTRMT